jgi:hypothetical protein
MLPYSWLSRSLSTPSGRLFLTGEKQPKWLLAAWLSAPIPIPMSRSRSSRLPVKWKNWPRQSIYLRTVLRLQSKHSPLGRQPDEL